MKAKRLLFFFLLTLLKLNSFAQGRVVINEYMPWVANDKECGPTSEFVELFNFGPGPLNIGCYILTDGDYSVTIPPNTILQPGQFYVISGQDYLAKGCANLDSAVTVHLNWNKCNCTSGNIPKTGDGFFTDGGNANEQVVLLDPALNVVDAVIRGLPAEPSSSITTSSVSGGCTSKTFNLGLMNFKYETIGESTGRANSIARVMDGDCGWDKDPAQSANATNNRSGDIASVTYNLTITNALDCNDSHGSISIGMEGNNISSYFPMNYVVAYDIDNDNAFTLLDQYIYGSDDSPPRIEIGGLKAGRYRVTLSSVLGCNLKTFDFSILSCTPILPLQVLSFKHLKTQQSMHSFEWTISEAETVRTIVLEQSGDNVSFTAASQQIVSGNRHGIQSFSTTIPVSGNRFFRLRITLKNGSVLYSATINTNSAVTLPVKRIWPNPSKNVINVEAGVVLPSIINYKIYSLQNSLVEQGSLHIGSFQYNFQLPIYRLAKGLYQLYVFSSGDFKPISFRFVKE